MGLRFGEKKKKSDRADKGKRPNVHQVRSSPEKKGMHDERGETSVELPEKGEKKKEGEGFTGKIPR